MAEIAVFFSDGFEEIEALTVVDLCRRANIKVDMVSVTKKKQVKGSHNIVIEMDQLIEDVDFDKIDMIVLPGGGAGTEGLEKNKCLMEHVDDFYKKGKYISAICAAPSILGHRGYLKGREACSYPSFESHLEGAQVIKEPVAVSEHIITSRGMGCSFEFGLAIVERFTDKVTAEKLAGAVIYNR